MATEITITLPEADSSNSVETAEVTAATIDTDMTITDAFVNKNNSLHIIVNATTAGDLTFTAGDNYPNAMLGDLAVTCAAGYNDIIIEDISRFENRDGSIALAGDGTLAGDIFAVAKRAGLKPAED